MGSFDDTAACEQVLPARDLLVQRALEVRRAGQHEDRIAAVAPVHGERPVQQMPVAIQGAEIRNVPIVAPGLARAVGLPRAELIELEKREPRPKPGVVLDLLRRHRSKPFRQVLRDSPAARERLRVDPRLCRQIAG